MKVLVNEPHGLNGTWQLNIPRIEDGNNFGVGVQEDIASELMNGVDDTFGILTDLSKYYQSRAKLASKVETEPVPLSLPRGRN